VLSIGAVLVLGLGVYLFVQVRAQPTTMPAQTLPSQPREIATPASPEPADASAPRTARVAAPAGSAAALESPSEPAAPDGSDGSAAGSAFGLSEDKLNAVMGEANKAYDRGDYDDAKALAQRLLARDPGNVRMLRILVSASCIDGDAAAAQASMAMLTAEDQERMRIRCARYGINLTVSGAK
jgi:predicted Zn-dependent protease